MPRLLPSTMTLPVACFPVGVRAASAPEGRIRLWSGREERQGREGRNA
ncbi:hypothetical protein PQG02_10305 [Nostoc sp. UHCC 0926]|nr:hypothetical protein [Nostoc sp. UHCC 0926]WDD34680.1 hypothetical protein PQG02_10305 [Nostoc sp. UHCC 0926]